MNDTILGLYERTLNNCRFYEKEGLKISLNNEIGVLRGIAYCMDLAGECPHNDEFNHFIDIQNKFKEEEKKED